MESEGGKEEGDDTASSKGYSSQCSDFLFSFEARKELKAIFKLSWPTALTYLAEESLSVVTILYCGHLGAVPLAAAALALSFTNITGFCIAFGLTSAFDTFCTQAMGAKQKKNIGIVIQRGLWILGVACFLVWAVWLNAEWFLRFMEQENEVARQAGMFCDIMSVGLPGRFAYILLQKYLQTMGMVIPTLIAGLVCNAVHALVSYILIFTLDYGIRGAAFGVVFSEVFYATVLFCYIRFKTPYKKIWPGWRSESLLEWGTFAKMALSGLFMILIDWSTSEAGAFLIGSVSVEELGAFAIINQLSGFLTMIPLGISLAASILVGNYLGAGQSVKAISVTKRCMIVGALCAVVVEVVVFATKDVIGYAFTDDKNVLAITSKALPIFLLFHGFDCIQMVLGGVLRGCGQQHYGLLINVICYNVIGLPLAIVFAVVMKLYNMGFWVGIAVAVLLQFTAYLLLVWKADWKKLSKQARMRAGIISTEELAPLSPISSCITTSAGSSLSGCKDGFIEEASSASATSSMLSSRSGSTVLTAEKLSFVEMCLRSDIEKIIQAGRWKSSVTTDNDVKKPLHPEMAIETRCYQNKPFNIKINNDTRYRAASEEVQDVKKPLNPYIEKAIEAKCLKNKSTDIKINLMPRNRVTAKIKATRLLIVILAVCVWIVGVLVRVLFPVPQDIGIIEEFRTSNVTNHSSYTGVYSTALRTKYLPQFLGI